MNYWMDYELRRIRGERPKYPEHNSKSFPPASSPSVTEEWDRLRKRMGVLLDELAASAQFPPAELDRQIETAHPGDTKVAGTLQAVLWQMMAPTSTTPVRSR